MKRTASVVITFVLALSLGLATGCTPDKTAETVTLDPTLAPPIIKSEGVLTVGIDFAYLPFSAEVDGRLEGIDVDVASLVAEDLGLRVAFVDVSPDDALVALEDGTVDIMMSTILGKVSATSIAMAGVYAAEAPGIFVASQEGTPTALDISSIKMGAQIGSLASWELKRSWGATDVKEYETLVDAFDALVAGEIDAVACDSMVGSHLISLYPTVSYLTQITPADAIGIGVSPDKKELGTAVQAVLDRAVVDGRVDLLLARWVGDMPKLTAEGAGTVFPTP